MANTLRFKRGLLAGLPSAAVGEPLFTTDTFDLYIGTASGTQKYQKFIASGTTSQLLRGDGSLLTMPIVLTSPSNGQVLKFNGTNWVNDSDAGITGSGTTNYLPRFTGATTLGNSTIFQGTRSLGFNTATPVDFGAGTYNFHLHDNGIPLIQFTNSTTGQSSSVGSRIQSNDNDLLFINSQATGVFRWNTNGAERMRLHSTGNLHLGGTTDNGLRFQVTGDGYFSGSVGIGTTGLTGVSLNVSKNITGAVASIGIVQAGQVQTDVTSVATGFRNVLNTAASTPLGDYYHIRLGQGTIGAGTTLTQQIGLYINDFANGTSRYGILSELSAGTGKWNLYMGGTAANYLNGSLGIGTTSITQKLTIHDGNLGFSNTAGGGEIFRIGVGASTSQIAINVGGTTGFAYSTISDTTKGQMFVRDSHTNSFPSYSFLTDTNTGISNANGTADTLAFITGGTERMRLDSSGNLGLGVTPSAWYTPSTSVLQIRHSSFYSQADGGNYYTFIGNNYFQDAGTFFKYINTGSATQYRQFNGQHIWYNAPSGSANATITFTQAMTLFATGNLAVGTPTDAGFKLDVNGTMRVSGASTFVGNMLISRGSTSPTTLSVEDGTNTTSTESYLKLVAGTTQGYVLSWGQTKSTYKILGAGDVSLYKSGTAGDVAIFNDMSTGGIKMAAGGSSTAHFTIASTGAATFSSSVTAGSFIPTSSTIPTNGMYLQQPNELAFSTNSAFRMAITSSFVSIGIANPSGGYGDGVGVELSPLGYIQSYRSQGVSATFGRHTTTGSIQTFFYGTTVGSSAQIGAIGTDGTGLTLSGGAFGTTHLTIASGGAATFSSIITSADTYGFTLGGLLNAARIQYGSDAATSFSLLNNSNGYAGLYAGAVVLSGNLTVDTNTLFVDAANNRVGVKQSSPTSSLHVDGSNARSYVTKTANYTMTENDYTVLCDTTSGGFTITLPAASGCAGRIYCIKKTIGNSGVNNVTIDGNASETIDGSTTISLQCRSSVIIQSDGSNWWVLAEKNDASCI